MISRSRPLVRTDPNGRPYIAPGDVPPRTRYPAAKPAQPTSAPAGATEPAPKSRRITKLTDDDVRAIRADYATGRWTRTDLAYIHGVSKNTIGAVINFDTHAHVKPQPPEQES